MTNNKPKVSVLMSVFNCQDYVGQAIESILSQTFKDFEFIIIDDGSKDKTKDILLAWAEKDPRIKVVANPENIGLTKSLNKAIKMAQGEYLARQDADDVSLPERLEKQVDFLDNHQSVKLLGTFGYAIDKEGRILKKEILPTSSRRIKRALIKMNPFFHTSVMIRKEILDRVGGYNEKFLVVQDYELWFRILRIAEGENLPLFLVKKRHQPEMISFKRDREQIKSIIFLKKGIIKKRDYPKLCYVYLLKSYFSLGCPSFLKKLFKKI